MRTIPNLLGSLGVAAAVLFLSTPAHALEERCIASIYTTAESGGRRTASGRPLFDSELTAAHKTRAFGSRVLVTNRMNGKTVIVTITDRGPFVRGRCIDLTRAGAKALGIGGTGYVTVSDAPAPVQIVDDLIDSFADRFSGSFPYRR